MVLSGFIALATRKGRTGVDKTKPFCISKREVWEAYKRVRANRGAAGVDGQTLAQFEEDVGNHLYRIWNRMSSGSYMPASVRRVEIPKSDGRIRPLGGRQDLLEAIRQAGCASCASASRACSRTAIAIARLTVGN